ncbi:diphosphoinositol polyphosphate phosphohydrolase 1-like isoform X3 [Megalops cyprinoides]|uniref:diphosphoinositol polyphosphate phosphohydrolase 1-like isoform X3 n=1 Tax=Megalops cyprinoides TaxID=118141 RepID=UPI00186400F9|nr:diphosphoinositol polyphosphate phosphohydrolase 1-like isoform X3 [Megalops cyprinoides]XP_036386367.1 diphosphoinositol polyphosphate phosphohydrolase 1-like isoform X3 [Megalops cyprinoides]
MQDALMQDEQHSSVVLVGKRSSRLQGVEAVSFIQLAGVKGTLGRLVGIFENRDRKHRTYVYVLIVTEVLEDWEDSVNIGRKREWFKIDDAIKVLECHKPVQATYFHALQQGCLSSNGTPLVAAIADDLSPTYSISQSSMSGIR